MPNLLPPRIWQRCQFVQQCQPSSTLLPGQPSDLHSAGSFLVRESHPPLSTPLCYGSLLRSTHMTSCYLNYLSKAPVSKYSHILRYWGCGLPHINCQGNTNQPITLPICITDLMKLENIEENTMSAVTSCARGCLLGLLN